MKDPDSLPEPIFKPHCLHLDAETVFLASRKLYKMTGSKRMLSSFVNRLLEEFVLEDDEREGGVTIRQKARDLAEKIKQEKAGQRKLVIDSETQKIEQQKAESERQDLIRKRTTEAVRKIGFRREWLRDPPGMNFSHHRRELEDEVSIACRLDLQFKDILPIVAEEVLGGDS